MALSANQRKRARHIARMRVVIAEAKNRPCADCGESYPPYVMDFDHVRGEKVANVSLLVGTGKSKTRILDEIAKCEVVCANCHRERTHRRAVEIRDVL